MIQYKNYTVVREDDRNWQVFCRETAVAIKDHKDKHGTVTVIKGEEYERDRSVGFTPDVGKALSLVVRDLAGRGCGTIKELADQIREIQSDLSSLTTSNI